MAYARTYQYETSPRKLEPEYEPIKKVYPKKSTAKRVTRREQAKKNKAIQRKIIFYIAICFAALFVISYRYSMIDDTYAVLKQEKANLLEVEKEATQLKANIESSLNLTKIEEDARNELGMQKLSDAQIIWVTIPKTDHVETSSKEVESTDLEPNWFMEIIDKIVKNFQT